MNLQLARIKYDEALDRLAVARTPAERSKREGELLRARQVLERAEERESRIVERRLRARW